MKKNRREFLLSSAAAATSLAAASHLPAQTALAGPAHPTSAASPKIRGLMIDAARVPETLDSYRRLIAFCAEWQFNTIHFRIADDQGTALRFASAPQLVTHKNAFTPDQLHALALFAQSHRIDIIPEIESFGHTGFITRSPTYAHLLDDAVKDSEEFTGIIPVHPETLELFAKLYRELAGIFPSTYLHAGCDEVNWGGSALSRKVLQAKSRAQIWTEYLNSLHSLAANHHKQLIVWGDFVLHKQPEILTHLDKRIVIMDWNYAETDPAKIQLALGQIRANGFRAIGAPALINYQWGPRAGSHQLRNIDAFAATYFEPHDTASLGVVLTSWVPCRYLQTSIVDGFAYAAVAFNESPAAARESAFRRFVETHYRAAWNENWAVIFHIVYEYAPSVEKFEDSSSLSLPLSVPWSSDDQLSDLLKNGAAHPTPFAHLRELLRQVSPGIQQNQSDFRSFELSIEYLERMFARHAEVLDHAKMPLTAETSASLIQSIAARDRTLLSSLTQDWNTGRFPNAEAAQQSVVALAPKDQLLFQWHRATEYSSSLAANPARFLQLLQSSKAK